MNDPSCTAIPRLRTALFIVLPHPFRVNTKKLLLCVFKKVFKKDGTVTVGNSSGMNDGASAVVLMSESMAGKLNRAPLCGVVAGACTGVNPRIMGIGPAKAIPMALKKRGSPSGISTYLRTTKPLPPNRSAA
jgi:hypothetical protein